MKIRLCAGTRPLSFLLPAISLLAMPLMDMSQARAAPPGIDWPTFGGSAQRTGYNPAETILSTSTVPNLTLHWSVNVGNGSYLQPSLVRAVKTQAGKFDVVFVTTTAGVKALDAATGNQLWSAPMAPVSYTCEGNTRNVGIGQPATIDVASKTLYVVDGGGFLHALAIGTGAEQAGYPVEVIDAANLAAETGVSHASPTLVGTTLYLGTAAFCESATVPYHGQVIQFDTKTKSVQGRYYPVGNGKVLGGGVWGPGGVAAEADGSYLWAGTANTLPPPQNHGNGEKIIQLDPKLKPVAENGPLLRKSGDLDFGATPLMFQPAGCPPMLAAMNKSGILVVYNRASLAGGPVQTLQISAGGGAGQFLGMPAWDPVTNALYLSNPANSPDGTYLYGVIALQANAACQLALLWHQYAGVMVAGSNPAIPPTVANGVVWYAGSIAGQVAAFDASSGTPLWNSGTNVATPTKAAPLVANGQVFFMGGDFIYAYGL